MAQLATGYRGSRDWRDVSESTRFHFTKPAGVSSSYHVMINILWEGRVNAITPLGAARKLTQLGDSQKSACFSEIPLDLLGELFERRSRMHLWRRHQERRRRERPRVDRVARLSIDRRVCERRTDRVSRRPRVSRPSVAICSQS